MVVLLDSLKVLKEKGCRFVCDFVGGETVEMDAAMFQAEVAEAASAAKDVAAAVSDKNLKAIDKTKTADIIEKAYKGLDDIIYRYNQKGQALGEDDKLRAGITAQSMEGSILESAVMEDPAPNPF